MSDHEDKFPVVSANFKKHMERLSYEGYMTSYAFRLFHQTIYQPTDIHWHEFFEMAFIINGEGTHLLNGDCFKLTPGSLFFLTPADFHSLIPPKEKTLELYNVIFSEAMIEDDVSHFLFQGIGYRHITFDVAHAEKIETYFRRLEDEVSLSRSGYQRIIHSIMQCILIEVARSTRSSQFTNGNPLSHHHKLHKALAFMHHHFREPITLQSAANQVAMSRNYFSTYFREITGVSYQRYLQQLRLRFAKALLLVSSLPVTEICYASGFQTLSHFERAFKIEYGKSPSLCRSEQKSLMDNGCSREEGSI